MRNISKKYLLIGAAVGAVVLILPLIWISNRTDAHQNAPKNPPRHAVEQTRPAPTPVPGVKAVAPAIKPSPQAPPPKQLSFPVHTNILTTVFWVGEEASTDNAGIPNLSSAWNSDWVAAFGGVDDPGARNGYFPTFKPKENPFYFALPFGDYTEAGRKPKLQQIYWYKPTQTGSILKNRWIKVTLGGRSAYGQWQDVGPFVSDDGGYVFGPNRPSQRVGLDVSPAMQDYLGFRGTATVNWQFVEEAKVPTGPWKNIITRTPPVW